MAKAKAEKQDLLKKELYVLMVLMLIAIATIAALLIDSRETELTAWATIQSWELHNFFKDCRGQGGELDVRPNSAPPIVFICNFVNEGRQIEYALAAGRSKKK
ncbi:hypothetical protein GOV11_03930 [Candidatus Woesearchaeota archaeon]|nr:hypothetical protein [Candidatus Woesearchaeota archaeon]